MVEIAAQGGVCGYGEGTPRRYVTGEVMDESLLVLKGLGEYVIEKDIGEKEGLFELLHELRQKFASSPSALCGFEIALFDLFSKVKEVPVWKLLVDYPKCKEISYSSILPLLSKKVRTSILELTKSYGILQIKAKASGISETVDVVSDIKNTLGNHAEIRIDANGAFSPEEAISLIDELRKRGLSILYFEQPCEKKDLPGLKKVEEETGVFVIADESFCNKGDLENIIEKGICKGINVRLSKCGGLLNSMELVKMASDAGLFCQLGCHVGETSILASAGRHLAAACGPFTFTEGCYSKFLLKDDLVKERLAFGKYGKAVIPQAPGLGVQVDKTLIEKNCQKVFEIGS